MLWLCSAQICSACNSGVPDETSVDNCWKKVILSSKVIFLCGLLDTRARAMNQSSKAMGSLLYSSLLMATVKTSSRLVNPSRTLSRPLSNSSFMPCSRAAARSSGSGVRVWIRFAMRAVMRTTSKTPTRPR